MSVSQVSPAPNERAKPEAQGYSLFNPFYYLFFPGVVAIGYFVAIVLHLPYFMIFFIYGLLPLMDRYTSKDWLNPTLAEIQKLQQDDRFRFMLYLSIFLDWSATVYGMSQVIQYSWFEIIPLCFLLGNLASTGFIIAHEMFHKQSLLDKVALKYLGTVHQIKNLYMHFYVQHIFGHHKRVATPHDPASAPKGMTLYQFLPRCVWGTYSHAFQLRPYFVVGSTLASIAFLYLMYLFKGLPGMCFTICSISISVLYLETINYIEHYGLRRKLLPDGVTYEKTTIRHSWNAAHRMSNYLFFKLQRHSDHHENSMKPYQTLCSYEDSPQLPHGYTVCIIMAMFPKFWFDMMDPLVDEYQRSEKGTNIQTYALACQKAQKFVNNLCYATFGLVLVELARHIWVRYA